jgi:hypothetical protein
MPGTIQYAEWYRGVRDGIMIRETFSSESEQSQSPSKEHPEGVGSLTLDDVRTSLKIDLGPFVAESLGVSERDFVGRLFD